jgi:hypothetical protein
LTLDSDWPQKITLSISGFWDAVSSEFLANG